MPVDREPGEEQSRHGGAGRDGQQARFSKPGHGRSKLVNFRLRLLIPITVHGADIQPVLARGHIGDGN